MVRLTNLTEALDDGPAATPAPAPEVPAPVVEEEPRRRFTMLSTAAEEDQARRLTDSVIALAGIRPTKGMRADVVRALVAIAADDERLQRKVAAIVRKAAGKRPRR